MQKIMAEDLDYIDCHNQAINLDDPPVAQKMFKSLYVGLRKCKLFHALSSSPTVFKDTICEFWNAAAFGMDNDSGELAITSVVRGVSIRITEKVIRDVLRIEDSAEDPSVFKKEKLGPTVKRMGYEKDPNSVPPLHKKLVHPYWRCLIHMFAQSMCGNRGGIDQLNGVQASGIVALVNGWSFNFSKMILVEMKSNLDGKRKKYAMYPRFIQMILDKCYPMVNTGREVYDQKIMPHSVLAQLQSSQTGKLIYRGLHPLEKFGMFSEIETGMVGQGEPRIAVSSDRIVDLEETQFRLWKFHLLTDLLRF